MTQYITLQEEMRRIERAQNRIRKNQTNYIAAYLIFDIQLFLQKIKKQFNNLIKILIYYKLFNLNLIDSMIIFS